MMLKKYFMWSLALSIFAFGCEDDRDLIVAQLGDAPVITSPEAGLSVDITEDNLTDVFATISWTPADFGFTAAVNYKIEMDVAGNSFAEAVELGATTKLDLDVNNTKVNNIMVAKGLPGGEFTNMEIRVRASASAELDELVSQAITVSVSPVAVEIDYPKLGVPGSYQGWDPANEATVIYSANSDGIFDGYLYIGEDAAAHKFTDGPSWDVNWGDTGADGILDPNGDDIVLGTAGVYRFSANINTLTHSSLRTDWGIIGDATPGGWDNDTDMTYDQTTGLWTVNIDLVGGLFVKFRVNDGWDLDLGDNDTDGKMEYGGENIPVAESGNYTVTLDLTNAVYTYTLTKN
jgi:hypothetical protein